MAGGAGTGASAHLRQVAQGWAARGATVAVVAGDRLEGDLPLAHLDRALTAVGAPGPLTAGTGLGQLARWAAALPAPPAPPLVLALDDLHWWDADSLGLLAALLRRPEAAGRLVVLAARRARPGPAAEVTAALVAAGLARPTALGPWGPRRTEGWLAARLGTERAAPVAGEVHRITAGTPLLLALVLPALAGGEAPGGLALPAAVLDRLAPGPGERAVVDALALVGGPVPALLLAAVAGAGPADAQAALAALVADAVVVDTPEGVALASPLVARAAAGALAPSRRSWLHGRWFAALDRAGLDRAAADHARRGDLVGDRRAAHLLHRVGKGELRRGDVAAGLAHLEAARRCAADRPTVALLADTCGALLAGDRPLEAGAVAEEILRHDQLSPRQQADALGALARAHFVAGDRRTSAHRFEQVVALAGDLDPEGVVPAVVAYALSSWTSTGLAHALELVERAGPVAAGRPALEGQVAAARGLLLLLAGDPREAAATAAVAEAAAVAVGGDRHALGWTWSPMLIHGLSCTVTEHFAEAGAAFATGATAAGELGSVESLTALAITEAAALARQGRIAQALASVERGIALSDLVPLGSTYAHTIRAQLLLHLGRPGEAAEACRQVEPAARARGELSTLISLWSVQAKLALAGGDAAGAAGLAARIEAASDEVGVGEPCLWPWAADAIAAHSLAGRPGDAERVIDWLAAAADRLPCRWPRIAAHTGRAQLALAARHPDEAVGHLDAALALHGEVDLPLDRAEALLARGTALRQRRDLGGARRSLRQGLEVAEATGSVWLGARLRAELARAGGRRGGSRHRLALTAQERRTAELASRGLTNRQIAATLFVSVRTVEAHLQHAYAKLGIHSRRQLRPEVLDSGSPDGGAPGAPEVSDRPARPG